MELKSKFAVYDFVFMLERGKAVEYMVTDVIIRVSGKRGLFFQKKLELDETYNVQRVRDKFQFSGIRTSQLFATKDELLKSI